jgi:repressor LexA
MKKQNLCNQEIELLRTIRNWIIHEGKSPSVRQLMTFLNYKSPNSVDYYIQKLISKGYLNRSERGQLQVNNFENGVFQTNTIDIPIVGAIACGAPILAEENIIDTIPVDTQLIKPPYQYFILVAKGNSMNKKGINSGDLLLIRQQPTAKNGDIIVALINDEATVKEFNLVGDKIILKPYSTDKSHKAIILSDNLIIQGIVSSVIPKI